MDARMIHPELDGNSIYLSSGRQGVLLLHGFTATTVEVRPMAEALFASGYSVSAPLMPGHGVNPEEMNQISWKDWVGSAEAACLELSARCEQVVVMGESMGGLLALNLAAHHPELNGVVLFAPALSINGLAKSRIARWFVKTTPKKYLAEGASTEIFPWQGYSVVPVGGAAQLFALQKETKKILGKIQKPALIFQGRKDRTINPHSSEWVLQGIASRDKELIDLEKSGHCILLDCEFDAVKLRTLQFLEGAFSGRI